MTEIEFRDPPKTPNNEVDEFATTLKNHPGRWAVFKELDGSGAAAATRHRINHGLGKSWAPKGSFESRIGRSEHGYEVFVRYLGELPS